MQPALIVLGGAWDIPDEAVDACNSGCHRALTAGWSILSRGGSALDAIEAAIIVLEDDPVFDAGYDSHLHFDRRVPRDRTRINGATPRPRPSATLPHNKTPRQAAPGLLQLPRASRRASAPGPNRGLIPTAPPHPA